MRIYISLLARHNFKIYSEDFPRNRIALYKGWDNWVHIRHSPQVGIKCISQIFVLNKISKGTLCLGISKFKNILLLPELYCMMESNHSKIHIIVSYLRATYNPFSSYLWVTYDSLLSDLWVRNRIADYWLHVWHANGIVHSTYGADLGTEEEQQIHLHMSQSGFRLTTRHHWTYWTYSHDPWPNSVANSRKFEICSQIGHQSFFKIVCWFHLGRH